MKPDTHDFKALNAQLVSFQTTAKSQPGSADAHLNVALTLDALGRSRDAIGAFKTAVFLAPRHVDGLASLAGAYNKIGQSQDAVATCEKALLIDPAHVGALGNLGSALRQLGRFDEAADAYEKALAVTPESYALHLNLGNLHLDTDTPEAAVPCFEAAIGIDPAHADPHAMLGEAYRRMGQGDLAIGAFQKALKRDPKHVLAHLNLGICLSQAGFLQEAAAVLVRALPISGNDVRVLANLGTCLYELGQIDKAILAFRRAISQPESSADALSRLALMPTGTLTSDIVAQIKKALDAQSAEDQSKARFAFATASYLRHMRQTDDAFAMIKAANAQKAAEQAAAISQEATERAKVLTRVRAWQPKPVDAPALGVTPLVILGPSRSGKSTLEHLLCKTPAVAPFFEGVWAGGYRFHQGTTDAGSEQPQRLENGFAARFQKHLCATGVRHGTYTNPHWIRVIDFAIDRIPDARFIMIKRNKIDLAAEIFATHYANGNLYSYDPKALMDYLAWYDDVLAAVADKLPGRILTLTTQELAEHTAETVGKVAVHAGVPLNTDALASTDFLDRKSTYHDHFAGLLASL